MNKVHIKLEAQFAHFASPGGKVERVSYPYPTPSAIDGAIRSIYWKPEIEYKIHEVHVLKPVQRYEYTTNEIKTSHAKASRKMQPIDAAANRTQRKNSVLMDVAYVAVVEPRLTKPCEHGIEKHYEMLKRRVGKGQCFRTPFLGMREYRCDFSLAKGDEKPIDRDEELWHYHIGWEDSEEGRMAVFGNVEMINGIIYF